MGDRPRDQPVETHGAISNRPSTSQIASSGKWATPTVVRAWRPFSPNNSRDEIGGAVHRRRQRLVAALDAEKAAEPDHAHHFVEVADDGLDLRQHIDGGEPRRRLRGVEAIAGLELADMGRGELAVGAERQLAGDEDEISGLYGADVIGDRRGGL